MPLRRVNLVSTTGSCGCIGRATREPAPHVRRSSPMGTLEMPVFCWHCRPFPQRLQLADGSKSTGIPSRAQVCQLSMPPTSLNLTFFH